MLVFDNPHCEKVFFLMPNWNYSHCNLCLLPLILPLCTSEKTVAPSSLELPLGSFEQQLDDP